MWLIISQRISNLGKIKKVAQCKYKLRNLKDAYKKAKDNNKKSGASPQFPPFYGDFDSILGCRDVINIPELVEVGSANDEDDASYSNDSSNTGKLNYFNFADLSLLYIFLPMLLFNNNCSNDSK